MIDHNEKRSFPRQAQQETVFIRVLLSDGKSIETQTDDISAGGFKASLSQYLEPGTILHVVIKAGAPPIDYLLAAELRWCKKTAEGFGAGFELLDARESDYVVWQAYCSN